MQNALLEFARVLKTKEQVIAGKIYYLTLEAIDGGKKKIYEAKIWVKPWMNFIQLQEFKLAHVTSPFRSSNLGVKQGEGLLISSHEYPSRMFLSSPLCCTMSPQFMVELRRTSFN
uniref:Cysteine proteinase inhibitor n=1 Tax=Lotus japonicus TaxID=34305 RepID=I3SBX7_LOTJA|nr:unknown [Lotus japonicus]